MSIQRWIEREASQYPLPLRTRGRSPLSGVERNQLVDEFLRRNRNRNMHRAFTDPGCVHKTISQLEADGFSRPSIEEIYRKITDMVWGG